MGVQGSGFGVQERARVADLVWIIGLPHQTVDYELVWKVNMPGRNQPQDFMYRCKLGTGWRGYGLGFRVWG